MNSKKIYKLEKNKTTTWHTFLKKEKKEKRLVGYFSWARHGARHVWARHEWARAQARVGTARHDTK